MFVVGFVGIGDVGVVDVEVVDVEFDWGVWVVVLWCLFWCLCLGVFVVCCWWGGGRSGWGLGLGWFVDVFLVVFVLFVVD